MLRLDFLSVKTTVSLVFNKIPSVFRTWKNCEFVCKNKLNYFVLKVSILRDFAVFLRLCSLYRIAFAPTRKPNRKAGLLLSS